MNTIEQTIDQLTSAFEAHGYFVGASPISGEEALFAAHLKEGFAKVEREIERNAKNYGTRGLSKRALHLLHIGLPEPVWGVAISKPD